MMAKLKSCPFCGGEAKLKEVPQASEIYFVECDDCKIRTLLKYDREEAIADWNARTEAPIAENTLKSVFMDLITDSMDGKYNGYTPSAMIQECSERVIEAIQYQKVND